MHSFNHVLFHFLFLRHGRPPSSCESYTKTIQQWQRRRQNERVWFVIYLTLPVMIESYPTMASLLALNHLTSHRVTAHHIAPSCTISYLILNILPSLHLISFHTHIVLLRPALCHQVSHHRTLRYHYLTYHIH